MTDRAPSPASVPSTVAVAVLLAVPQTLAVAALSGIGHRWVDILAQFTGPALIVAIAGLAWARLLRSKALVVAAAAACLLVVAAGWPQWAPARGRPVEGGESFTLYSANLHARNTDVEAIGRSIAEADADVVALVEVGPGFSRRDLDVMLAGYPHRAIRGAPLHPEAALSLIASRRPLTDLRLSIRYLSVVGAVVETPLGPVTVAGVHMTRPWPYQIQWEQIRQAEGLSGWARSVDGPVVAAGDFNSVSSARIGKIIKQDGGLVPAPGWPATWPSALPAFAGITIDQVYRTPDLALVERRLGRPNGSDHRPVITRFVRAAPDG